MEKAPFIYIDHLSSDEQIEFTERLKVRLSRINSEVKIIRFQDIRKSTKQGIDIRKLIIDAIDKSMITVALISEKYLDELETDEAFYKSITEIQEANNRYIFPIIFSETNWLKSEWLVKSRLYPSNSSIDKMDIKEQEKEIDELANKIDTILNATKKISSGASKLTVETKDNKIRSNTVFISHSNHDADFAELLKLKLEKAKIPSWLDNERLKIGQDWREEIDDGIKASKAVIVIVSPEAKESEYVTYEWAFAWGQGKRVFPIMLKKTQLHPRLESLQYLNFVNRSARPWDDLIESIKKIKT